MAEFKKLVITTKGQALMAKLMSGAATAQFTKISVSETAYTDAQLEGLTSLSGIKQSTPISKIIRTNNVAVQVEGALTNTELAAGYYMRTIGLFAIDPDDGEILYAVTNASQAGYMPPYNGITVSGAFFKLVTTVSNASNVTLEVDPAAVATIGDVQDLQKQISDLQAYIGYTDDDIFGVEADFTNRKFTRLAGSVNRTPGASFNTVNAFGGRRRCIVTDDGKVLAYYGEPGYVENGALTQAITIGEETYPVGTAVQVMVEQPKFYYKVVPLKLDKIENGKGYHLRKARYYVSDTKKAGFKLHPAFIHAQNEKDYIYLAAYEGSIYDVSESTYILDDAQVLETGSAGDKFSSIANAKPASGLTQNLNREAVTGLALRRGVPGWYQSLPTTVAASQLLFMIEYASFNSQSSIGMGAVSKTDDGTTSMTEVTGATSSLGNASGSVTNGNGINIVSYRGEENLWGNIWTWVMDCYITGNGQHDLFITDRWERTAIYRLTGITLAKTNGYVSAFGYQENYDWLFVTSETLGNSTLPVGDYFYQNNTYNGQLAALLGGQWNDGATAGAFCWHVNAAASYRDRGIGGRLVYVPGITN
ncbi:putative heme/steroid binding protein [Fontibacillus solani]|uniref:Putative heme/steroid binding protein n=1 Tax=Fontibacillus solani TaxID=1572857 RepID=A0A7W3SWK3_9BACL|nr:phage tail protein [Fontibacillus solani]MBA9087463.1 putative heme/steroid binding protein [Fontibacillus solani]